MRWWIVIILFSSSPLWSQDIPTGTWRSHLSYRNVMDIEEVGDRVYVLTVGGLFYFQKSDNSIEKLSSVNGLRRAGVTAIESISGSYLAVGYDGGEIDLISETEIVGINDIIQSDFPETTKTVNHIEARGSQFYVSTGFGLVVFNASTLKVFETYWQLDSNGNDLEVYASSINSTHIVLATEDGLMAGALSDNLIDPNNWNRFFGSGISRTVVELNNIIYAGIEGDGMFEFDGNQWIEVDFDNENFISINDGNGLVWVCTTNGCSEWTSGSSQLIDFTEGTPNVGYSSSGIDWIGSDNGLFRKEGSVYTPIIPDGPYSSMNWSVSFSNGLISVLSGGYNVLYDELQVRSGLYQFSPTGWKNFNESTIPSLVDFTDPVQITYSDQMQKWVIACYNRGVFLFDGVSFEELTLPASLDTKISGAISDSDGLWLIDTEGSPSIYNFDPSNNWSSFSISGVPPLYGRKMVSDRDYLYVLTDPIIAGNILMIEKETGISRELSTMVNEGDFPGTPTAIDIDLRNNIWVGTSNGVAYFRSSFIDEPINSFTPISEFSPLLRGQKINDIEVDGGDRKWIATDDGVLLMDPRGENVVLQFTTDNSPLLSDKVQDIAVNKITGEVFFITDKGLISYRGDATTASGNLGSVKIFPNPVYPGYSGVVTMEGLIFETSVKITDVSGNLIWESQSNGGTAVWDLLSYNGKKVSSGMYYVYLSSADGLESLAGKIAIIR